MTGALLYQARPQWRLGLALAGAILIHLAALSFATNNSPAPAGPSSVDGEPPTLTFEPPDPIADPATDLSEPLPTPPSIEPAFIDDPSTPPPVRRQVNKVTPIVRPHTNTVSPSMNLSAAKVLAVSAPRPEYPYEARRQKITGEGVVTMTVDPVTGNVVSVSILKSTGSPFLDNAAVAGFKRWRFKPGTVSAVTCPVTFTLTGAAY
jgi:TonB family protein